MPRPFGSGRPTAVHRFHAPSGGVRFTVMPGSLRLRLPALFLLGIVIAGLVSAIIAVQLFQGYTRNQSYEELGREAKGIARLYADAALRAAEEGTPAPDFAPGALELATGDQLFYVGAPPFPGQDPGLQQLPEASVPSAVLASDKSLEFEFRPPGQARTFLAVVPAAPARTWRPGARRDRRREGPGRGSRPVAAAGRQARRRVRDRRSPRLAPRSLAHAADQRSGRGARPCVRRDRTRELRGARSRRARRRRDLASLRALQRDGRPPGRDRGARAPVPDVGLPRAPYAAHRDQGPRRRAP